MHLGVNLIFLVPGETGGTETYARELVPQLLAQRPDLRLTFFVNRETGVSGTPWAELGTCVQVPVHARRRTEWVRGEQFLLPDLVRRSGCDLLHSLANTAPLRGSIPRVTTVHDLLHRGRAGAHAPAHSAFLRMLVPRVIASSTRVIVPSRWTLAEMTALSRCDPARIDLVAQGPGSTAATVPAPVADVRRALRLDGRSVVLVVAPLQRHKNLPVTLEALASIPPGPRPALVLAGRPTPFGDTLRRRADALDVADDVRFAGTVSGAELEALYTLADCVVAPSPHEGFGFPPVEAMARGTPAICADGGALPEVVGDAALLFPAASASALAAAIESVIGDPAESERLRSAGRRRAGELSWADAARKTLASYDAALA